MNSLYPTVMVEKMPVRDFRWATQKNLDDILEFCKTAQYDKIPPCTLSVNLKHNPKNFDKEKKFAMCPEVYDENKVKKLAHTLFDKNYYVNQAILYTEEAWLEGYINMCVEERQKAEKERNDEQLFW